LHQQHVILEAETMTSRLDAPTAANVRVVITGIGLWTPLGSDRESTWRSLVGGRSASRWLMSPQWTGAARMAGVPCEMPAESVTQGIDPVIALARRASAEAVQDAGLDAGMLASDATGVVFGTSKGGLHTAARLLANSDHSAGPAGDWLDLWPNAAARHIAASFGCRGPLLAPVAACATGLAACLRGVELIRDGRCNIVLAGSSDASLQPAILGSFRRLGILAIHPDDPSKACRPFDRTRSGFVVGEGAGCLILESLPHALARGAKWYAEWLGGRMLSDPAGLTQLDPEGMSLKRLLRDLQIDVPGLPDYINLHGTATLPNDRVESAAVRAVLGADADQIACSSLKGGLGHLLGAAGSVELAATLLAIRDQIVPPTVNLFDPDPELDLNFTPRQSQRRRIQRAWKLSLGFGGHLSAACIGRLTGPGDRTVRNAPTGNVD
jgi:3-oxoacyl-[acyl-carrier-protein] synthase II